MTTRVILPIALLTATVLAGKELTNGLDSRGSRRHEDLKARLDGMTHAQDASQSGGYHHPNADAVTVHSDQLSEQYGSTKPSYHPAGTWGPYTPDQLNQPQPAPGTTDDTNYVAGLDAVGNPNETGWQKRPYNCVWCDREYSTEGNPTDANTGLELCRECKIHGHPDQRINDTTDISAVSTHCTACGGRGCNYCNEQLPLAPEVVEPETHANDNMERHPDPSAPYYPGKWGIYSFANEQEYLLKQIDVADSQKGTSLEKEIPCLTIEGNENPNTRKRYLVRNRKGQQVYLVKTLGSTGNGSYYNHDGDKREPHNENTVGEFTTGGLWYTVYWRCQKPNHDDCSHETS